MIVKRFLGALTLRLVTAYNPATHKVVFWDPSNGELVEGPLASALGGGGGGVTDHGALTGLADDDHTQYHTDARGDARYYTQAAVDAALAGKSNTGHSHDHGTLTGLGDDDHTQYHTDARGDARYYTQAAVDAALAGKSDTGHTHDHGALTGLGDDDHTQYLLADGTRALSGNLTITGTVDGRDVAADGTKLDGIESGATADQTGAEIKALYEAEADTNAFTDAEKTKLAGVETGATADQTGAEIKALYEAEANTNAFTDAEQTKLAGIEAGATSDQTGSEILAALLPVDGPGSTLDADTLDGQHAADFAPAAHTHDHGALTGLADDDHTQYHTDARGDARYYTQAAVDSALAGKSDTSHTHDHGALTGLADDDHTQYHTDARGDARYYTQAAVDAALAGKSDTSHTHVLADVTDAGALAALDTVGTAQVDDNAVTLAKIQDIATATILGRSTAGTGDVEALTAALVRAILNVEEGATVGLGKSNQTLTGNRTIDDGDNGYSLFVELQSLSKVVQFLLNPSIPSAAWSVNDGTNQAILQNTGALINLLFSSGAALAINSDAGAAGECLTSGGSGAPPSWLGYPVYSGTSAPSNTNLLWYNTNAGFQELFAYDTVLGEWLSTNTYKLAFARNTSTTASHYMRGLGNFDYNSAGGLGYPVGYNCKVIRAYGRVPAGTSGWLHRVMKYDQSASSNGVGAQDFPAGTYVNWKMEGLDVDYDEGDAIALNMFNTGSVTACANHTAVVEYKRRP